jgi:protoporphyrinogen/coproporphyrinogen III oxidase
LSDLKIKIIGGGFSGLIQAYYLIEKGLSVQVIEKDNRLGGLIGSHQNQDFLSETAANAFMANREIEYICKKIQVNLIPTKESAKKRFIYREGQMRRWPLKPLQFIDFIFLYIKIKIFILKKNNKKTITLRDWLILNSSREFNDFLFEPALLGIFATSTKNLNADLVFRSLFKKYPKGKMRGSVAPKQGMQEFIDQLKNYLKNNGCEFLLEKQMSDYSKSDKIIFAVGLSHLKKLQEEKLIDLPDSLKETKTTSLTSVTVFFKDKKKFTEGFGCLFPRAEGFNSLGVLFNNNIFSHRAKNGICETWILNDDIMAFSKMSKMALIRYVLSDRFKLFNKWVEPTEVDINQWSDRIPVYNDKLQVFLNDLENYESSFLFVGNYLGQLGLSKIIFRARLNAEKLGKIINV